MPIRAENRARYPADWPAISHRIRFERAGSRCECAGECGRDHGGRCAALHGAEKLTVTDNRGIVRSTVLLTTAHRAAPIEDCSDENLVAMCQGCHLSYDIDAHQRTRARNRDAAAGQLYLAAELSP